jgi:hypothetical protein
MYQIIECSSKVVIFESENFDRAIEKFEMMISGVGEFTYIRYEFSSLVLQKAERIDRWDKTTIQMLLYKKKPTVN